MLHLDNGFFETFDILRQLFSFDRPEIFSKKFSIESYAYGFIGVRAMSMLMYLDPIVSFQENVLAGSYCLLLAIIGNLNLSGIHVNQCMMWQ